jgi:hypothetical protein
LPWPLNSRHPVHQDFVTVPPARPKRRNGSRSAVGISRTCPRARAAHYGNLRPPTPSHFPLGACRSLEDIVCGADEGKTGQKAARFGQRRSKGACGLPPGQGRTDAPLRCPGKEFGHSDPMADPRGAVRDPRPQLGAVLFPQLELTHDPIMLPFSGRARGQHRRHMGAGCGGL